MPTIHSILKEYWGYNSFRPLQEDIINTVLKGDDCLALLPTGGGKSICFQVPAMVMDGLCLVVTPLIALMKDQVEGLRRKGITAFSIHAGMNRNEVIKTLSTAGNSNCKFLYVSPERLETNVFKEFLPSLGVSMIAVDEAHCISQWGYDFRPAYLKIATLREELPSVPVLALTASATADVQQDICDKLQFSEPKIFRQSFARPNLSYSVFQVPSKINKIVEVLEKVEGTAIVYCRSRKKTKDISDLLNMRNISADYYHAGLPQEERSEKQEAWLHDKTRVICCTNAFGMGIDKPGVRAVIHADVPECLENYYQEAGRAGRDGKRSYAVLLVAADELALLESSANRKFPSLDTIRDIYKSLMNYLQVPAGSGEGNYFEFDAATFLQDFELDAPTVFSVLKTLEQEEMLYFNEQVYMQPKIQVVASRERMFEFEKENAALEPLLKTILRNYAGVVDQQVNISEKNLAYLLRKEVEEVKVLLNELHRLRIIEYVPKKDKPQVYFFQNRVRSEDLMINTRRYYDSKRRFEERVKAMSGYVNTLTCRSVSIGKYFGDDDIANCVICDNCLDKKKSTVTATDFEQISSRITSTLKLEPLHIKKLTASIKGKPTATVKQVIDFLLAEEIIQVSQTGIVTLKNTSLPASASKS